MTYAITTGNTDGIFEIDGNGMITVADASMLDYESGTTSYTLTITATDGLDADGDPDTTADDTIMVTINVMDINDESPTVAPTTGTGAVRITDGTPPATATNTGYTITVTDADASNDFAVSVRGDSRFDFVRQQNSDTWDLVLLANRAIPAAELNSEITLTYTVTDGGVGTIAARGTVTLDVVDTPVSFMPTTAAARMVNEGDTGWFLQLTAQSVDETLQGAARTSPIARYEFVGDSDGFAIDESTGRITLTDAFDYEDATERTHSLTIRATDSRTPMAEMGETSITINVQDVNDNSPIFVTNAEDSTLSTGTEMVDENTGAGTVFARVRATDADGTARYSTVTYSITAGNPGNAFAINEDTGEIRVNGALDYEAATFYTLTVTASDNQAGSIDAIQTITVNIGDVNDNAPMVTADSDTIRTTTGNTDNTPTGYSITVTDADTVGTLMVNSDDPSFRFDRAGANSDTWNLILLAGEAITAGPISIGYTATDGVNSRSGTITLTAVDTPVEFAPITDSTALMTPENDDSWSLQVTATSEDSDSDGSDSDIASYDILQVRDANGMVVQNNGVFSITDAGLISISGTRLTTKPAPLTP